MSFKYSQQVTGVSVGLAWQLQSSTQEIELEGARGFDSMLDWLRRRDAYTFRTVLYENEGTWVAHAADPRLSGFGASQEQALADVRGLLESYVTSLNGAHVIAVERPVKSDDELRQIGDLILVEIPNPHEPPPILAWPSWLPRLRSARSWRASA